MNEDISYSDCSGSQYLKQDDVSEDGQTVTIEAWEKKFIEGHNGEQGKKKVCVKFEEFDKWLPLNSTNGDAIRTHTKTQKPEESIGSQLEIYRDANIAFGGKIVGGIRLRPVVEIPY